MTVDVAIYDWRSQIKPKDQLFRAGGQAIAGGMTLGGARVQSPEPGGRAELVWRFALLGRSISVGRDVSWTVSRMLNGNVMRVPLCASPQLVTASDLDGPDSGGVLWSNEQTWSNGQPWNWNPTAPVAASASRGAPSFTVDMSDWGEVLQIGHVIGFTVGAYDFAHMVMDITYDESDVATVEINPPLRRALTTDSEMRFRPRMLVTCPNAQQVAEVFEYRSFSALNEIRFVEALV